MLSHIRPALVMIVLFTILTGLLYPLAVTGIAQTLMHGQAEGSLIRGPGAQVIGSGEPRIGAHGTPILFLHPKGTGGVLVELMETPKDGH